MVYFKRSLLVAAGLVLALGAAPASAQKQKLTHAYFWGPSHHMLKTTQAWIKTVEEASHGNLEIVMDTAGIGSPPGQYDLVKNGVRDTVWFIAGYTPGRFPLYQVAELPFVCPSATVCSPALWQWYTKNKLDQREFTDTKLLVSFVHGPGNLHAKKELRTLEDLKNLKIRAGGSNIAVTKHLDATVIAMPANEAYEALQRNTVDAVWFPWEAMQSFRLNEITTFHLEVPGGMYSSSFGININPKAFDGLNAANRQALMKASGLEGSKLFGRRWDAADKPARADAIARKQTIATLAPAELPKWRAKLKPIRDEWLDMAKKKGLDGEKLLNDFEASVKAFSS